MQRRALLLGLTGGALLAAGPQGKGKGQAKKARGAPGFGPEEQRVIRAYFQNPPSGLPPGLGKRGGDLPPGLEKQVRRKGQLPPGLQKRLAPFPPDLAGRLAVLPEGHERGILGNLAIVWSPATGLIVDVLVIAGR